MVERAEEIFQTLLDAGIDEDELIAQVKEKEIEFQGFMTKQAILYLIAKENGVNVDSSENVEILEHITEEVIDYSDFAISVSQITENMKNIVIAGRINEIMGRREFRKKDGTRGIVSSFKVCDQSDCIKVVLWNEQTEIMDNTFFQLGEIIQIVGGYSKKGLNDNLELHLARQGKLILAPKGVSLPEAKNKNNSRFIKKKVNNIPSKHIIEELYNREGFIRFAKGMIKIHDFKEFTQKNGEKSFLLKFILSDESGSITVNIWGLKAVEYMKILVDDVNIKLTNVLIKENSYSNEKEISSTKSTQLKII